MTTFQLLVTIGLLLIWSYKCPTLKLHNSAQHKVKIEALNLYLFKGKVRLQAISIS